MLKAAAVELNAYSPEREHGSVQRTEMRALVDNFRQSADLRQLRQREIESEVAKVQDLRLQNCER